MDSGGNVKGTHECFKFRDVEYTKLIVDGFREISLCKEHVVKTYINTTESV